MLVTRSLCACVGALSLCLPLGVLAADAPATPKPRPLRLDFEGDQLPEGCAALDGEAALALTHEPEHVASGKGALEFR